MAGSSTAEPSSNNEEAANSPIGTLIPYGDSIWIVNGPEVSFYGFPYPTRMVVVGLHDESGKPNGSWVWSPVSYKEELAQSMHNATGGPVRIIISPNYIHHIFLDEWQQACGSGEGEGPAVYASPGLPGRKVLPQTLNFTGTLTDDPPAGTYGDEIEQVIFYSGVLDEVVFFHRRSKTVIFCDLIQRHPCEKCTGFKGWLMKADGVAGPQGSTPKEWRFAFWAQRKRPQARLTLAKVLDEWKPEQLIIAHGDCARSNATEIVRQALNWMTL